MIDIQNLNLFYKNTQILKNINFNLQNFKIVSIIGKSGSGKSMFAKSFIRLFDENFMINAKKFCVNNQEILNLNQKSLENYRRNTTSLIFQNAKACLHPLMDVGEHFDYYFGKDIKKTAFEYFLKFGFKDPDLLWHKYSYELSGGEASRVNITLALCVKPKILICDEITSGLDVKNQKHIIEILKSIKNETSIIFISHQKNVVEILSDEIWQMNDGRLKKC